MKNLEIAKEKVGKDPNLVDLSRQTYPSQRKVFLEEQRMQLTQGGY
jgi:hypothetical protein